MVKKIIFIDTHDDAQFGSVLFKNICLTHYHGIQIEQQQYKIDA